MISRAAGTARQAGSKAAESVAQHPVVAGVIGAGITAGLGILAARAIRKPASNKTSKGEDDTSEDSSEGEEEDEEEDSAEDQPHHEEQNANQPQHSGNLFGSMRDRIGEIIAPMRNGASRLGQQGRNGLTTVRSGLRKGASSARAGVGEGYEYGKDTLATLWRRHPLTLSGGVLALGFAAGMIVPSFAAEQKLVSGSLGKVTRRIRKASRELLSQGKELSEKVWAETGNAVSEMADREGLTPQKLSRKVKRIASRVKDAVSNAFED